MPKWIPKGVSHEETIGTERTKKYPLLVMSNHPRWGVHSQHDDITWLREIETCKVKGPDGYQYQPLWMNPVDAAAAGHQARRRGLASSTSGARSWPEPTSPSASCPGAVGIDHGAKYDPIVAGGDRPGRGHQHHRARGTSPPRTPAGMAVSRLPGRGGEGRPGGAARPSTRRPSPGSVTSRAGPCLAGFMEGGA